jgi:virginiamycin A acetyltransferase
VPFLMKKMGIKAMSKIHEYLERFLARTIAWGLISLTKCSAYVHVAELASLIPFELGNNTRYFFYRRTLSQCGEDVTINFGTILTYPEIRIGSHCWIGPFNTIGLADLGDYTLTAQGCHIISGAHTHLFDHTDIPIMAQGGSPRRCQIGPDVWIGAGSIIMANVGRGSVIGAGSVVRKDIPDWAVAAGNPAKVIRSRLGTKPEKPISRERSAEPSASPLDVDSL